MLNRSIATQEVIEELIKLAKEMSAATQRGVDLGLNDDEVAYYDALAANDGDVKRLTNFDCDYRLRSGDYRVLFDVEDDRIIVHRVLHRREAYD